MTDSRIEYIVSATNAKPSGSNQWLGHGPCHGSRRSRDLSIALRGYRILLHCFAGCEKSAVCQALGLELRDLFLDALDSDPQKRKAAALQREAQRRERDREARKLGRLFDACKAAERYLSSRQPADISAWNDERLDRELGLITDAFLILEGDPYAS